MRGKPKSILQSTLELFSPNNSAFHGDNNNNIHYTQINQTCPNVKPLPIHSSTKEISPTSNQDNCPTKPKINDNFDYYQNIINQMNNDITNINQKLSNIDTSILTSSRLSSDPDNLLNSRRNNMPNDSERNINSGNKTQMFFETLENERKIINQLRLDYETSMAAKNAKMIELEQHKKMLLEKKHYLEQQIQALEKNYSKETPMQKINEDENKLKQLSIIKNKDNISQTYDYVPPVNKDKIIIDNKINITESLPPSSKRSSKTSERIRNKKKLHNNKKVMKEETHSINTNCGDDYKKYLEQLKHAINENEFSNKNELLNLVQIIGKITEDKIKEIEIKHKEAMKESLNIICQLEEENTILKNKVLKIKEIAK